MKLLDIFFGRRKQPESIAQKASSKAAPKPAVPLGSTETYGQAFAGQTCPNDGHDFVCPYPFHCRKCGLVLQWNATQIEKHMGSYFDGKSYQWTERMNTNDITSFTISAGDRPGFEANCDFSVLRIRNCLHGSRDGWMLSKYPKEYFEPREIKLQEIDAAKLKRHLASCNFFAWETPVHYVENHDAPGFFVEKQFSCVFSNGKKFTCLKPEDTEFAQLVSMLREMAAQNAAEADRAFVRRILEDTEKKKSRFIGW